ncbi:hypothetical protein ABT403_29120 [Streptomyces sp. NPDC000075]|uniref:hypothetical protein n=1 Tax=Streptomyces TaxID=1883 RepID=UPI0031D27E97
MIRERGAYYELYGSDFGLTALTERLALTGSRTDLDIALCAAEIADCFEGEGAVELGEDARRLLASDLPEHVLSTVWLSATGHAFDPRGHGMSCRAWLEQVSDVSTARLRQEKRSYVPSPVRPVRDAVLCRAVVVELRAMAPGLTGATALPDLVDALEQVVTGADGDLGMRLFLRALKARAVPVPYEGYLRLQELGWRFGFPAAVVHDGLTILWPAVSTSRCRLHGDFGLSRLAGLFTAGWHHRTPGQAVEHALVGDGYERPPGSEAAVLLEDTRRLLDSGLPDDAITLVWLAATERGYNIDLLGIAGREWLRQIADRCEENLSAVAPVYAPANTAPAGDGGAEVLREIRELAPLAAGTVISPAFHPLESSTVMEALEQVVVRADPDLGFRLFLPIVAILRLPLTEEQYTRYESLASRFHYGEQHLLFTVHHLVRHT